VYPLKLSPVDKGLTGWVIMWDFPMLHAPWGVRLAQQSSIKPPTHCAGTVYKLSFSGGFALGTLDSPS